MRISRTEPQNQVSKPRGGKRASGGGDFAGALEGGGPAESGTAAAAGSIAGVDSLLALQDVGDESENKRQAAEHGQRLLDRLDGLRLDLLEGRLSAETVEQLAGEVDAARAETDDAKLNEILDEIELRAQVELAKLGRV